jgi:hypothetical protein
LTNPALLEEIIIDQQSAGDLLRLRLQILDLESPPQSHFKEECSMSYKVYLYNIPKVSEDGKQAIPVQDSQMKEFNSVDDAKKFATEHKSDFGRVVLMQEDSDREKMIERYVDGL